MAQTYKTFLQRAAEADKYLPKYIEKEFEEFLRCGILAYGFLRLQCGDCKHERLVAFSCKKRGFCSSCSRRRMCESAAHLVDEVFPFVGVRQWVLSFPFPVRFLLAKNPALKAKFLTIVLRIIKKYLNQKLGTKNLQTGAVTFIQRFGGSLNLNPHLHMLLLDGCYDQDGKFKEIPSPSNEEIASLVKEISKRLLRYLQKTQELQKLESTTEPDLLDEMQSASVQSLIAIAENRGGRVGRIGSFGYTEEVKVTEKLCAMSNGFSLHAGGVLPSPRVRKIRAAL